MGLQILILQSCCQELCASWKPRADWLCVAASLCACLYLLLLVFVKQRCVTLFGSSQTSTSPLLIKKMFLISQWMWKEQHGGLWWRTIFIADSQGIVTICSFASSITTPVIQFFTFYILLVSIRWALGEVLVFTVPFFPLFLSRMEVVKLWFTDRKSFNYTCSMEIKDVRDKRWMCW